MSTASGTVDTRSTRKRDLVVLAVGAGVFTLGAGLFGAYCVACDHPATVAVEDAR
ncbi:hypothetical protein [Streptomyces sp. NPDC102437]|uniref:hypothetical protein n=1 Tax=Streptomyces sp. NPDC102437 TaxID=3366175 RepID=UPI0038001683